MMYYLRSKEDALLKDLYAERAIFKCIQHLLEPVEILSLTKHGRGI